MSSDRLNQSGEAFDRDQPYMFPTDIGVGIELDLICGVQTVLDTAASSSLVVDYVIASVL